MAHHFTALTLVAALIGLVACESERPPAVDPAPEPEPTDTTGTPDLDQAWHRDLLTYCDGLIDRFRASADNLNGQVAQLTTAPSAATLNAARSTWRQTMTAWGGASLCLQAPLPEASPDQHREWFSRTAASPAMAGFIDAVPGYDDSGLVHDETVNLTLENLVRQHQVTDDGEVALGLYALEVLLFGAIPRSADDFAPAGDLDSVPLTDQSHQARRSRMTSLLAIDLAHQTRQWQGYWRTLTDAVVAEDYSDAMTWQWSRALDQAGWLSQELDRERPGLALTREHDELYLEALFTAVSHWWTEPSTLGQAERIGLSAQEWDAAGEQLIDPDPATRRGTAELSARLLRDLSRRLEAAGH